MFSVGKRRRRLLRVNFLSPHYLFHTLLTPSRCSKQTHLMLNGPGLSGTSPSQGKKMLRLGVTRASHRPSGSVTRMTKYDEKEGELDL